MRLNKLIAIYRHAGTGAEMPCVYFDGLTTSDLETNASSPHFGVLTREIPAPRTRIRLTISFLRARRMLHQIVRDDAISSINKSINQY